MARIVYLVCDVWVQALDLNPPIFAKSGVPVGLPVAARFPGLLVDEVRHIAFQGRRPLQHDGGGTLRTPHQRRLWHRH